MVKEARLEQRDTGLTPVTHGWFVVGIADAPWVTNEALGAACAFEGDEVQFPDVGFTLHVLQPGQANGMYHREANQEDFLVLAGECLLLIEGEERRLEAWGLLHRPPHTEHGFVGAGDRPGGPAGGAGAARGRGGSPPRRMPRSRSGSLVPRTTGMACPGPSGHGCPVR